MEQDVYLPSTSILGGGGESASLLEDVEMISDLSNESAQYICVDTNILLQRFGIIKALYTAFSEHGQGEVKLLIPFIVINELDGLTANHSPAPHNPQITISEAARAGTHWLLEASRARTGAIRFQKWVERVDTSLIKGDDRVLDCCLHFRGAGDKGVVLWTDDRNLALLAEANDIQTAGGPSISPVRLIDRLPLSLPDGLRDHLTNIPPESYQDSTAHRQNDEDGMELDLDILPIPYPDPALLLIHMPMTASASSRAHTDTTSQIDLPPFPFPFPKRRTSPSKSSPPLPSPLALEIGMAFIPFYDSLPLPPTSIRRTFGPSSSPQAVVKRTLKALEMLEKNWIGDGINVELLKTISAFRVLSASIDPEVVSRRPRTGEVADALDELRELIAMLGCTVDQQELSRLSSTVRDL